MAFIRRAQDQADGRRFPPTDGRTRLGKGFAFVRKFRVIELKDSDVWHARSVNGVLAPAVD